MDLVRPEPTTTAPPEVTHPEPARVTRLLRGSGAAELLHRARQLVPSQAVLASQLGATSSHLSRVAAGLAGLGVSFCFRLAAILQEDAAHVLRACGHGDVADCLATVPAATAPRSEPLHEAIDRLSLDDRLLVARVVQRLLSAEVASIIFPQAAGRPSSPRPLFNSLTSLVIRVEGRDGAADVEMLRMIERAAIKLRGVGLLLPRECRSSESPLLKAIEDIATVIWTSRGEAPAQTYRDHRSEVQQRADRLKAQMRIRTETAYYLGMALGWHASHRFGGSR